MSKNKTKIMIAMEIFKGVIYLSLNRRPRETKIGVDIHDTKINIFIRFRVTLVGWLISSLILLFLSQAMAVR